MTRTPYLTKSRYVAGLQCAKQLWWRVHEADAPELTPDPATQAAFDRGRRVGERARAHVPGGVLIDVPFHALPARVAATRAAIEGGARAVYEAAFLEDDVFVAVDILERGGRGFSLIEVKSSLSVKDPHVPDVAVQLHVLREAGLPVARAEVMHLNRECRHPDLSNLFVRADVTARAEAAGADLPAQVRALREALAGPLPDVAPGAHCREPYECPFLARCWPALPKYHVSTLYRIRAPEVARLEAQGRPTIPDLPADFPATGPTRRQIEAVRRGTVVIEGGLDRALDALRPPIAFLDFETIAPAIPVWPGCAPYEKVPVQFSCHVARPEGLVHLAWLADGPEDPREPIARALLSACEGASTVLAYHAPFEVECVLRLAAALPDLAPALRRLAGRLVDLLPIVRDHVYHPDFQGSFSIKSVLPALVPGLGYDDLDIRDGGVASATLERLLLDEASVPAAERPTLRARLLAYGERDTLAMVRLLDRLRALAAGPRAT